MRYFIYCRKSTEAEDRQVASIESQLTTLQRTFGEKTEIEIVRVYQESFSAKAPGRPIFGEMMAAINKGEAVGIISWAPDRLARNSIDGGQIVYMLDCGVIKDLKFATYTFENNPNGKFMLQIMFGQSKYYSDALSENVRRGIRSKLEKGWRCGKAPLGYLNEPTSRTIVPDPERFHLVRQMFDLMLTGTHTPKRIWEITHNVWGLRTPKLKKIGGKPIALAAVYRIFHSSFYAGFFKWEGQSYRGAHVPMITIREYERIQTLLGAEEKPKPHHRRFAFTGMIRCGECGLLVTAEEKTNAYGSHYTYYHCTRRRPDARCRQPSITAENLEAQMMHFVSMVRVSTKIDEWAHGRLDEDDREHQDIIENQRNSARKAVENTGREIANLISLRTRELITDAEFVAERSKLEQHKLRLQEQLAQQPDATFELDRTLVSFRIRALDWFKAGGWEEKRLIADTIGSNFVLKDKIVTGEAKKPFRLMAQSNNFISWCGLRENIRTLYLEHDPELLHIVDNIKLLEARFGSLLKDDFRLAA
jgi:DNA invertase Pin-like site-specific DNA recombinase